jgi:hypothetical protein
MLVGNDIFGILEIPAEICQTNSLFHPKFIKKIKFRQII